MRLQVDELGHVGIQVDDWDITREYNSRVITTDYSTWITYISRKKVPANTPITDTEYWKPICKLSRELLFDYNKFKEETTTIVNSFLNTHGGGIAFSNELGDSEIIGVTQKKVTQEVNRLDSRINETSPGEFSYSNDITEINYNNEEL
ncbi:MAG: hypothetical protein IJG68_02000 [Bacilli bacterium]|nr:hypothetical protein [Bacilli bacterium]